MSSTVDHDRTTTTTPIDPRAIAAALLQHIEGAWNDADGTRFGDAFTEDAEFVDIRGTHHRGRTAIAQGHQAIFDTIYAGSAVRYHLDVARTIAPGAILAVASATLEVPAGPLQGVNHARLSVAIARYGDGWRIAGFHNTLVASGR